MGGAGHGTVARYMHSPLSDATSGARAKGDDENGLVRCCAELTRTPKYDIVHQDIHYQTLIYYHIFATRRPITEDCVPTVALV